MLDPINVQFHKLGYILKVYFNFILEDNILRK